MGVNYSRVTSADGFFFLLGTGTPALTSRGFTEEDFEKVAEYFVRAVEIAVKVTKSSGETSTNFFLLTELDLYTQVWMWLM
jgi:hypothetical protein